MNNTFDFDSIIDRRNTNCAKWDTQSQKYGKNDLIHLGVADMDFKSPQPILDALQKVVEHGVFGYTDLNEAFYGSIQHWLKKRAGVDIPKEWIVFCPRINISSSICVNSLTETKANVVINSPAYSPLMDAILKNNRKAIINPLILKNERFSMDMDYLESLVNEDTQMFILVNPDNPSGRTWSKEELGELSDFCLRHNLILFVDEIHADILAEGVEHTSMLSLPGEIQERLVYASSLTKTFNIPGLVVSYMVIPNEEVREKIKGDIDRIGMHNPNIFSVAAVEAGYNRCDEWLAAVNAYIDDNEIFFRDFLEENMPKFHVMPREGTYLLWIDYKKLNVSEDELKKWFIDDAKVEVYMGSNFGEHGIGYIRVNLAAPRELLKQALVRMKEAYN